MTAGANAKPHKFAMSNFAKKRVIKQRILKNA